MNGYQHPIDVWTGLSEVWAETWDFDSFSVTEFPLLVSDGDTGLPFCYSRSGFSFIRCVADGSLLGLDH